MQTRKSLKGHFSAYNPPVGRFLPRYQWPAAVALAVAAELTGFSGATAHAEGFRNPPEGAFGLERSGGRIAQVDDASAVANNPANLIDLQKMMFSFDPEAVYISTRFESGTGTVGQTREPWKVLPNFFCLLPPLRWQSGAGTGRDDPLRTLE